VKNLSTIRSALAIIGGGLVAMPASGLELGEVTVQSALGQPLRASIAYSLAPFESLSDGCITVGPVGGSVSFANGAIMISGKSVIREPLISMRLAISCNYTPHLTREYTLFVDPVVPTLIEAPTPIEAPAPERVATVRPAIAEEPTVVAAPAPVPAPVADAVPEPVVPEEQSSAYEPAAAPAPAPAPAPQVVDEPIPEASPSPVDELQPGDVIVDRIEAPVDEVVAVPDVPVAVIRERPSSPKSSLTSNWLLWLGGGVAAIVIALMLLGRRIRKHFGSSPIAPAEPKRHVSETQTDSVPAIGEIDVLIDDDSPTAENLALDADLLAGTGLQEGDDVDVAQDFGFAATTELDLDLVLPEEIPDSDEAPQTDILPPLHADEGKILDDEVLAEEDDYDLSINVDATNMPAPDDVTQRDLEAVQVDDSDETLIGNDYTVSKEVDYKIVEQDYEEEMTATQAINEEILNATTEAAANESSEDDTVEMPKDDKKAS